jgi:flavin-binding protein dodecin
MTVARVTEIIASSPESFDDAVRQGLKRAAKTLKNIKGAWVEGQKVTCDAQGHVQEFRVILKVTFVLEN